MTSRSSTTHWPRILVLWLCGILAALQFAKISLAFQALQQWYAISPASTGLLLSMVGLVGLVLGVTVGLIAPACGYRRLLLAGLGLGAVLSFIQSLMPSYPLFVVTRVLEGASHLAIVVAAPTLMMAHTAPHHRSIVMGLWSTFVAVAFVLAGALGAPVLAWDGVGGVLRLHAAGMALMLVAVVIAVAADPVPGRDWPLLRALPGYHRQIYTRLPTALPGLCFFCYTAMAVALLTFLPQSAGDDQRWLAVVLPLMGVGGAFCAGWLAQTWISPLLLVRLAFGSVALAGVWVWLCAQIGFAIAPAALLLMFLTGLSGGAAFSLIPYLSDENQIHARANGAVAQMGNVGSTLGPPLFAALIAPLGMLGLALPVVLFALLGIGLATWGTRLQKATA